ncbi:hypothetical protein Ccrd_009885 [Cynara cardunculus var. scolymus]|uniref:Hly-III-related protein n=1 Tax=Cynara cardunculus var. scolymus TaxID=59895 RepID=A0A118K746_CYNCS|nr:hypothetical protein Ccrd_009885 [Cynara cardunculus var. scolymus]
MKGEIGEMDETQFLNSNKKVKKIQVKNKFPLLRYEELPDYMKDNEYILNYYRANWSLKQALISLFLCHNETLNVWTAFGSDHSSTITHQLVSPYMNTTPFQTEATHWPLFVFLGGSMFCFVSSSLCHLFSCHTQHLSCLLSQLDYVGIAVMIITSFFPPIYYTFQCTPLWQYIYLGGITILGVIAVMVLLSPTRVNGKYRFIRTSIFVAMGLFGVIPTIHGTIVNWNVAQRNTTLGFESTMAFCYLVGAMFYVSRVPEKWRPGWFDLIGHSHQIFHIFVVVAALAHYIAVLILYEYRRRVSCD